MSAVGETALSFGYSKIGYRLKQNGLSVMTVSTYLRWYRCPWLWCSCYDQGVTLC